MSNRDEMIKLCQAMVDIHSKSSSVFAGINKQIWESKLQNWYLLKQSPDQKQEKPKTI
jgi:hypothetical protein